MKKTFEETVRSMTAKEILMAMVNGIRAKYYLIEMSTFGKVEDEMCFACAATACISQISGVVLNQMNIEKSYRRAFALGTDAEFFEKFENAIDDLRKGYVEIYNQIARIEGFAQIERPDGFYLPYLHNGNVSIAIDKYEKLANLQK